ncbi:MAG: dolichyl-phosphate beta-glucosyltransferase [Pseudomonadota bacterium]
MKLSIIIPAYNEHDRIVHTLTQTLAFLKDRPYSAEILVVSDGSTDATGDVVKGFQTPENVTVVFLEYFPNRGKGFAVKYGMLRGGGDVIMFMDADYSVPMAAVERGLALLDDGCDVAIASRTMSGSRVVHHQNAWRELSAKLYTLIQNTYLGFSYRDTQCGFKLFRRQAAGRLFSQQKLSSVIFDPEILWLASREGYRVGEFPVDWTHMEDSRIQYDSIGKSLFIFQELFRIRRLHRRGK